MTSVGYIATFRMAAPTQAAVFMKILLILARSLAGAGGCVLAGLGSVWLTRVLGKASFSAGILGGASSLHLARSIYLPDSVTDLQVPRTPSPDSGRQKTGGQGTCVASALICRVALARLIY